MYHSTNKVTLLNKILKVCITVVAISFFLFLVATLAVALLKIAIVGVILVLLCYGVSYFLQAVKGKKETNDIKETKNHDNT